MAERRMFAKTIIDSDAFLDMPMSARLLYYDLAMRADDDGFINSPKKIMRCTGSMPDDLSILIVRKFIIPFENGIVVIKHWKIHNYIRKDMYHETKYKDEKSWLELDDNNAYTLQPCNDVVTNPSTQVRLGKVSLGKVSIEKDSCSVNGTVKKKFIPPSVKEVREYCLSVGSQIDPESFVAFYESKNWMIGKNKMVSWKSAIVTWEKRNGLKRKPVTKPNVVIEEEQELSDEEWLEMMKNES